MLAILLLYVGAVLSLNGVWLLGGIQDREIAVINWFTGGLGVLISIFTMLEGDIVNFNLAGLELLFAFTYIWVAWNQYTDVSNHGLGWYCLFVAITAAPTSYFVLDSAVTSGDLWLGANWGAWAVLWFLYFLLLGMQWPIRRLAGVVTLLEGIGTGWALGYLVLAQQVAFG